MLARYLQVKSGGSIDACSVYIRVERDDGGDFVLGAWSGYLGGDEYEVRFFHFDLEEEISNCWILMQLRIVHI